MFTVTCNNMPVMEECLMSRTPLLCLGASSTTTAAPDLMKVVLKGLMFPGFIYGGLEKMFNMYQNIHCSVTFMLETNFQCLIHNDYFTRDYRK